MARVYAVQADYAEYTGLDPIDVALIDGIDATLSRASGVIDELTLTANYTVDEDGLPTDPAIIEAMMRATCAQTAWFDDTGDISGSGAGYASMSIGSVNLSGSAGGVVDTTPGGARIGPEALTELGRVPGLLTTAPWVT